MESGVELVADTGVSPPLFLSLFFNRRTIAMQNKKRNMEYKQIAMQVSFVVILCNLFLSLLKTTVGLVAHSGALVSDGINSVFDVVSGVIVIVSAKASSKEADEEHPYGHERLESAASILLAILLFVTAVFIGHTVIEELVSGAFLSRTPPGLLTILAAIISIAVKEGMFWYTMKNAERLNSLSLKAEALDCRADVISTFGTLAGIIATRCGLMAGDSIASLFVCFFILRTAYEVFREAIGQMVDKSCDKKTEERIRESILGVEGVLGIDLLMIRVFGNRLYVDVEIVEDGSVSLRAAHQVAENVHDRIEAGFPNVKHIMVHVNPDR